MTALNKSKILWMNIAMTLGVMLVAQTASSANDCNDTVASSLEGFPFCTLSTDDFQRLNGCICNESFSACTLSIAHYRQQFYYLTSIQSTQSTNYTMSFICQVTVISNSTIGNLTCCRENSSCASDKQEAACGRSPLNVSRKTSSACDAMSFNLYSGQTADPLGDNASLASDSVCVRTESNLSEDGLDVGIIVGLSVGIFLVLVIVVVAGLMCRSRARKNETPPKRKTPEARLSSPNVYSTVLPTPSMRDRDNSSPKGDPGQAEPGRPRGQNSEEPPNLGYAVVGANLFEKELRDAEGSSVRETSESFTPPKDNAEVTTESYTDTCDINMGENEHIYPVSDDDDGSTMSTIYIGDGDDGDDDDYSKLRLEQKHLKNPYDTLLKQRQDPKLRQPMSRPSDNKLTSYELEGPESENGLTNHDGAISDNRLTGTYEHVVVIDLSSNPDITASVAKPDDYDYPVMAFPPTNNPNDIMDDYTTPGDAENNSRKSDPYSFPENEYLHSNFGPSSDSGQSSDGGKYSDLGLSSVVSGNRSDFERGKNDDPLYLLNKILNDEIPDEDEVDYSPINYYEHKELST
ncbi:unnamed protein product [Lymnaea stagnalis]|uniref:Uncharacterized protein n=1 Tax=Lymnaea stagnalis TaxID=6523 RepID=A0AAV2I5F7_LYMST